MPDRRVGAEWVGRARQLLRDVDAAEPAADAYGGKLVERIGRRLERKPTLRKDMLTTLVRDWRIAPELQRFRVAFVQTAEEVWEDRLTRATTRPSSDAAWRGWEPCLFIERLHLQLGKKSTDIDYYTVATVSLHALARWYQRNADTDEVALLRDLALLSASPETVGPFTVATPHGRWLGEPVTLRQDGRLQHLSSFPVQQRAHVAELRTMRSARIVRSARTFLGD